MRRFFFQFIHRITANKIEFADRLARDIVHVPESGHCLQWEHPHMSGNSLPIHQISFVTRFVGPYSAGHHL